MPLAIVSAYAGKAKPFPFQITLIKGGDLAENAFLISAKNNVFLIDALGSSIAAAQIVEAIKQSGKRLSKVFITHGHPDHFLGLSVIMQANPDAEIYTGSEEIKRDMIAYVQYATSRGLLEKEPSMKIKSSGHGGGFDFDRIKVHTAKALDLGHGVSLTIENVAAPAEANHNTILYSEQFNLLFASDIVYHKVFNWLGTGVDEDAIDGWIKTLNDLKTRFGSESLIVFPGHGAQADRTAFDANIHYLSSFNDILGRTKDKHDALLFFRKLYPGYQGEFLLSRSIDQWFDRIVVVFLVHQVDLRGHAESNTCGARRLDCFNCALFRAEATQESEVVIGRC
jgi:glyoxylase-like metal-dependent hydrolase (beta-lactamase superfamily II)